jgi:hypothetical protein
MLQKVVIRERRVDAGYGFNTVNHVLPLTVTIEAMQRAWQEWTQDREFMRKYKDLMVRKHEDWRDRESRRKLVD